MYNIIPRLSSLFLALLLVNQDSVKCLKLYHAVAARGKALHGYSFQNITEPAMEKCMAKCLQNCLCMSFQVCDDEICQMCSTTKELSPSAFREEKECTYFTFKEKLFRASDRNHPASCFSSINCCLKSKPCLTDGICEPASPTENRTRFKCRCPDGYTGDRCQDPVKSCRGYVNGVRVPGKYTIFDDELQPFEVFCDFDSYSTMAWTLIQSYKLQHKDQFLKPFYDNNPVNENSPAWGSYSLSKSRMISIKNDSSKWRITCRYDTDGVVYKDYIRASIDKIDILTFDSAACRQVEFINVRGQSCKQCTVRLYQTNNLPFHVDGYYHGNCRFRPTAGLPCNGQGEENFGLYGCQNPAHRCSANQTSTTQTWFGGN